MIRPIVLDVMTAIWLILFALYFLPWFISLARSSPNKGAVLLVCIGAVVMAVFVPGTIGTVLVWGLVIYGFVLAFKREPIGG